MAKIVEVITSMTYLIEVITSIRHIQANSFTLLGASYRLYSATLWIQSLSLAAANGTVFHLSSK
jgi:hypothetical protein